MKRNNLKVLATCLSILTSFVFFGCAQQSMNGAMDKNMGTATEGTMNTMQDEPMNNDMETMKDQKMGDTMNEMKNDAAKDDMGRMKDAPMTPAKDTMMK